MPFSARKNRESMEEREKGSFSAVPWTSTNSPWLVMTTLKSTSAQKSSS